MKTIGKILKFFAILFIAFIVADTLDILPQPKWRIEEEARIKEEERIEEEAKNKGPALSFKIEQNQTLPFPVSFLDEVNKAYSKAFKINYWGLDSLLADGDDINYLFYDNKDPRRSSLKVSITKNFRLNSQSSGYNYTVMDEACLAYLKKKKDSEESKQCEQLIEYILNRGLNTQKEGMSALSIVIQFCSEDEKNYDKMDFVIEKYKQFGFDPSSLDLNITGGNYETIKRLLAHGFKKELNLYVYNQGFMRKEARKDLKKLQVLVKNKDQMKGVDFIFGSLSHSNFSDYGPQKIRAFLNLGMPPNIIQSLKKEFVAWDQQECLQAMKQWEKEQR